MLDQEIDLIAKEWLQFLDKQYNLKSLDKNHVVLTTPITDAFDDGITIMITKKENDQYEISDQGYTIWNLTTRGINVMKKNSNRQKIIKSIVKSENVALAQDNTIYAQGQRQDIAQMIFNVIQAVTKIGNLGFTNFNNVRGMFADDVKDYFNSNNQKYQFLKGFELRGKTGLSYKIDYLFLSKNPTSKVTKIYDNLAKNTVEQLLGIWFDTEPTRKDNQKKMEYDIIVPSLSDSKQVDLANSLNSHDIKVYPFDDKELIENKFSFDAA